MKSIFSALFTFVCLIQINAIVCQMLTVKCDEKESITLQDHVYGIHESYYLLPNFRAKSNVFKTIAHGPENPFRTSSLFNNVKSDFLCKMRKRRRGRKSLQKHSTCPWHYVLNVDYHRIPSRMMEARCNCTNRCLGGTAKSRCEPVYYYYRVYRKVDEDRNGYCAYKETIEAISVGCTCVNHLKH